MSSRGENEIEVSRLKRTNASRVAIAEKADMKVEGNSGSDPYNLQKHDDGYKAQGRGIEMGDGTVDLGYRPDEEGAFNWDLSIQS